MKFERTNLINMGNYIAQQRKKKGYTQKQLAEFLDVSDKTVSKWEQGILAPDVTVLQPLAEALGTNIDSIVNGEHHKSIFRYTLGSKKHKLIIFFFVFTIVVAAFSFYMGGKGKYNLYKLQSFGAFIPKGYLINSDNETILVIENIKLNDSNNSIKDEVFKYASVEIYSDDILISTRDYTIGKKFALQEFLNNSSFVFEDKVKIDKSKLKINIIFYNLRGVRFSYLISFK